MKKKESSKRRLSCAVGIREVKRSEYYKKSTDFVSKTKSVLFFGIV